MRNQGRNDNNSISPLPGLFQLPKERTNAGKTSGNWIEREENVCHAKRIQEISRICDDDEDVYNNKCMCTYYQTYV